ncbi:cytochrome c oxidase subunit II [Halovulum sp. GXIMD14793]
MKPSSLFTVSALCAAFGAVAARAQDGITGLEVIGAPKPGGMALQPAVSEVARDTHFVDNMLLWIIIPISIFVMILLAIIILRFNQKANPEPARFTHNTPIEIIWTLVPVLILIVIGSFSLPVLFKQLEIPKSDLTVKVTGVQWAWEYEYPELEVGFGSYMLGAGAAEMNDAVRAELEDYGYEEQYWKLAVDEAMVVPVNRNILLQVGAADVIHSWKIPSLSVHLDGVPGRPNQTWFRAEQEGIYFGQCSELCGKDHAYMPIVVKVVSEEVFADWVENYHGGSMENYGPNVAAREAGEQPVDVAAAD